VWGWDVAKSIDWTVGIALDEEGVVCRLVRRQGSWATMLRMIIAETGSVPALVDSTGVGDAILEQLQQAEGSCFTGFHFSSQSKQQLMEGLAVAIQQRRIGVPAGPITAELESFEYEYRPTGVRYSAPEGVHDDCVCALALAVRHFATVFGVKPLRLLGGSTEFNPNTPFQRLWTRLHAPPVSRDWRCPQPDDGMPSSEAVGPNGPPASETIDRASKMD
jgi:hypothetical protein